MCQECFWLGRFSPPHSIDHQVKEYTSFVGWHRDPHLWCKFDIYLHLHIVWFLWECLDNWCVNLQYLFIWLLLFQFWARRDFNFIICNKFSPQYINDLTYVFISGFPALYIKLLTIIYAPPLQCTIYIYAHIRCSYIEILSLTLPWPMLNQTPTRHSFRRSLRCVPDRPTLDRPRFPEHPEKTLNLSHIVWVLMIICDKNWYLIDVILQFWMILFFFLCWGTSTFSGPFHWRSLLILRKLINSQYHILEIMHFLSCHSKSNDS